MNDELEQDVTNEETVDKLYNLILETGAPIKPMFLKALRDVDLFRM